MDTVFDRDTAVRRVEGGADDGAQATGETLFAADIASGWRAGRGPHGGYLAAMLLRALTATVDDLERTPRSLTIHYTRAPGPGPIVIRTLIEREGRSLSTLSARMEQDGRLMALALAAFSVPWHAPEISELPLPDVEPAEPRLDGPRPPHPMAPPFARHMEFQPRMGTRPFTGTQETPMEVGGWLALAEPRPLDALALAFFSDALFSPPFIRLTEPAVTPTVDLTIHFRASLARARGEGLGVDASQTAPLEADPVEHCFARFRSTVIHEGFFEEDGVIWAADGTVLLHSRQLALVMGLDASGHVVR
jgi:acyl-CoA thioesterase